MIENFRHRYSDSFEDTLNIGQLISEGNLTNEETLFLKRIKEAWNFYEGYHWEGIDDLDSPQVTFNYCRPFVNKFVAFEFGKGFSIKPPIEIEEVGIPINDPKIEIDLDKNKDGTLSEDELKQGYTIKEKTISDYLSQVWENNKKDIILTEKDVTDEKSFREYAKSVLKKMHGDDYDEKKAEEVIDGMIKDKKDDEDWGVLVGKLQKC